MTEEFDIVDEQNRVIGRAARTACHGDPGLIHRAVHVLVFNSHEELLLQKRADDKDIQPGRWDTSVGGHLDPGGEFFDAARREACEELGLCDLTLFPLYDSKIRNEIESENIRTFLALSESIGTISAREISEVRWWSAGEIEEALGQQLFTPYFEEEWQAWKHWRGNNDLPLEKYFTQG